MIWFQSDNGATREERASSYGKPYAGGSNAPYRAWKQGLFDGGMHVPAMLRAPGITQPGQVWERPMISMDLLPTFLALADPQAKPPEHIDGQSILPVLKNDSPPHEYLFWSFNNQRAVRYGDWKLILNPPSYPGDEIADKIWLSNLEADPAEKVNLATQNPARVQQLIQKIRAWERDVHLTP